MPARRATATVRRGPEEVEGADPHMPWGKIVAFLIAGPRRAAAGRGPAGRWRANIARDFGVRKTVIGLTLVALGTSLPELATTAAAAVRREADVAVGNVVGSNMFNLLGIIGVAALVGPLPVPEAMLRIDLWVMLGTSLAMAPFVYRGWPMGRAWGTVLIACYVGYVAFLVA